MCVCVSTPGVIVCRKWPCWQISPSVWNCSMRSLSCQFLTISVRMWSLAKEKLRDLLYIDMALFTGCSTQGIIRSRVKLHNYSLTRGFNWGFAKKVKKKICMTDTALHGLWQKENHRWMTQLKRMKKTNRTLEESIISHTVHGVPYLATKHFLLAHKPFSTHLLWLWRLQSLLHRDAVCWHVLQELQEVRAYCLW